MVKKKTKLILIFFFLILLVFICLKVFKKEKLTELKKDVSDEILYNSNVIKDVNYSSKDSKGNQYIIDATQGEIDYSDTNTIYLTNVKALIKLKNSDNITVTSDFGKYNTNNFDTIFSENVIIHYLENKITGEYLDFSIERNSMIVSRNLIYTNLENILTADVMEINLETKDTKIYMYENDKKVNIKNRY